MVQWTEAIGVRRARRLDRAAAEAAQRERHLADHREYHARDHMPIKVPATPASPMGADYAGMLPLPTICVLVPVFYRGDKFHKYIWGNFAKQSWPEKKLFVSRNVHPDDAKPENVADMQRARTFWQGKMRELPGTVHYQEVDKEAKDVASGKFSLGKKRNHMLSVASE